MELPTGEFPTFSGDFPRLETTQAERQHAHQQGEAPQEEGRCQGVQSGRYHGDQESGGHLLPPSSQSWEPEEVSEGDGKMKIFLFNFWTILFFQKLLKKLRKKKEILMFKNFCWVSFFSFFFYK